jgi:phosphoribosylformylglycinamidine synthase subunit PurS
MPRPPNRNRFTPKVCASWKKNWQPFLVSRTLAVDRLAGPARVDMKAKITITPKKAVVDPQGKAVQQALEQMGYHGIQAVHVGKYLEIEIAGDRAAARQQIDEACHKFLSNPIIEDYHFELE